MNPATVTTDYALLVIGYGNTLRQDDSAGPRVIELLEARALPGVHAFAYAQLSPEHAEAVANARAVVFVDAQVGAASKIQLQQVTPAESPQVTTHAADPQTLLALSRDVYGQAPPAWFLSIPIERLGFGTDISDLTRQCIDDAVNEIERLASLLPGCL